jgi:FkbM family methyltransferase
MSDIKIIEKEFIPNFFKESPKGRFLEIGANDGEPGNLHEPVWPLVEMGWSGVYCEPNPNACSKLLTNIKPYNNITVINGAVSIKGGLETFYITDDYPMVSSLDPNWISRQSFVPKNSDQYSITTNTFTMQDLVNCVGLDFNCISIDIENTHEVYEKLVNSFNWKLFNQCKVIVIELCNETIQNYFISIGYTCAGQSAYNTIFVR